MKRVIISAPEKTIKRFESFLIKLLTANIEKLIKDDGIRKRLINKMKPNQIFSFYLATFKDSSVSSIESELREIFIDIIYHVNNLLDLGSRRFNEVEKNMIDIFVQDNLLLIKSLLIDQHKALNLILSDAVVYGESIPNIEKKIREKANISKNRANVIAITETAKANSQLAINKFKDMGIQKVEWNSAKDKRVRKCHLARNGKQYDPQKGCYSGCDGKAIHSGHEVRCRCAMIVILKG